MRAFAQEVPNEDDDPQGVALPSNVISMSQKLEVILRQQGMTPARLAQKADISEVSVMRIINETSVYKTNNVIAERIAEALGVAVNQVLWPRGVSYLGRPGGTGGKLIGITNSPAKAVPACELHWLELPASGICGECTA